MHYDPGVPPENWTRAMLGFPQLEEDRHEEEAMHGRTDRADFAGRGDGHPRSGRSATWSLGTIHLSLETAVWADGGGGCARAPAVPAGKRQAQEGLSGTRSRSGSHQGTAGKKVVSPRARRHAAQAACAHGLSNCLECQ